MLTHASPNQAGEIYKQFVKRKDIFPHIRKDYMERTIASGNCVYEKGVIITYQQYKKSVKLGNITIPSGSVMLHQILNTEQYSGAGREIFQRFCDEIVYPLGGVLYLSVRADNQTACKFYERNGMIRLGTVNWQMQGEPLPGVIYLKQCSGENVAPKQKIKTMDDFFVSV
jgi:hypothetical protein